ADYVLTGNFSNNAYKEALLFGKAISVAGSTKEEKYKRIPEQNELKLDPGADYVHICENNTIYGSKWKYTPNTGNVPLVSDMSSCILSEPIDVTKYGLIYAGAQKNMGPSGLVVVIVRDDLLGNARPSTPQVLDWSAQAENASMLNTPPTFAIYMLALVLNWIKTQGGLTAMAARNKEKADTLYAAIDNSQFYANPVAVNARSWMNVPFTLANPDLDADFLAKAAKAGLTDLKGHRSVGGMRASIYNAMPLAGVQALIDFMEKYEAENS
ncbi:MAG: 3-phosphoserine/phosphohydroxythreonine transaminase, partial [Propionibacteriaceae bacterium]|nr:3-phosphoserine/phosphohydroxythreonine transaminase [Propionibacteriaceae bacterium]